MCTFIQSVSKCVDYVPFYKICLTVLIFFFYYWLLEEVWDSFSLFAPHMALGASLLLLHAYSLQWFCFSQSFDKVTPKIAYLLLARNLIFTVLMYPKNIQIDFESKITGALSWQPSTYLLCTCYFLLVQRGLHLLSISVAFWDNVSVRSPRKLFFFIIRKKKMVKSITVSQWYSKTISYHFENNTLVRTWCISVILFK